VAAAYKFEQIFRFDYPTTRLDALSQAEIIAAVSRVIAEAQPHSVYLNHAEMSFGSSDRSTVWLLRQTFL